MSLLADDVQAEIREILTTSAPNLPGNEGMSSVFEYEVDDGIFFGVDPRTDDETVIATLYIYVADMEGYTQHDDISFEEHDIIIRLLQDIKDIIDDAFAESDIDPETFPDSLERVEQDGARPSSYYSMTLPREPASQEAPE